jgi:hypothetical protein
MSSDEAVDDTVRFWGWLEHWTSVDNVVSCSCRQAGLDDVALQVVE